ncbi:hypothetical protein D9M71_502450 [compost metagenome]
MIEVDLEAHLETIERQEGGALAILLHGHRALDADELLRRFLLLQTGRLDEEDEGTGAAVHDRHFRCRQFDIGVVDTQASHGRKQVLNGIHLDVTLDQRGRQGGLTDVLGPSRNLHHGVEIGAAEHDTGIHRGRLQGEIDLLPRVQADAGGADDVLQSALFDHGFGRICTSCELFSVMAGMISEPAFTEHQSHQYS